MCFSAGVALERHHRLDLAAKHLGVELERGFAVAVEGQVGVQLHDVLLCERVDERSP
jgi:hypothetical protein